MPALYANDPRSDHRGPAPRRRAQERPEKAPSEFLDERAELSRWSDADVDRLIALLREGLT